MQIDDKKRNSFMEMMTSVADDRKCRIQFECRPDYPDYMKVIIAKDVLFVYETTIHWPRVKSQTDIATRIWSDFFEMYYSAKTTHDYSRCDLPLTVKKVHFNDPVTVVLWTDGTKTIVRCQDGDIYDPEKGLAMAIAKKALGNKGNYCEIFKKWLPVEVEVEDVECLYPTIPVINPKELVEAIRKLGRKNKLSVEGEE